MSALILPFPFSAKFNSPPRKQKNNDRKYLTLSEVERLINAAKKSLRYGHRNATAILIAYRHGLRSQELTNLKWSQIDLDSATLEVVRIKRGTCTNQPLDGRELRALRKLRRQFPHSAYIFNSERGTPLSTRQFRTIVAKAGQLAKLSIQAHPHQLRHGCGHYLAENLTDTRTIQDYLGHKNIAHTLIYTTATAARFKNLWKNA